MLKKPLNFTQKTQTTFFKLLFKQVTVETTRFAPLKLDSPPLDSIYCLPYKNEKTPKIGLCLGHHSSFKWRLYEKGPTLGLEHIHLGLK